MSIRLIEFEKWIKQFRKNNPKVKISKASLKLMEDAFDGGWLIYDEIRRSNVFYPNEII